MKRILNLCFLVVFVNAFAQTTLPPTGITSTENYVYSRTYLEAVTASSTSAKQAESVTYFDGLGRPKQSIAIKASALGRDVVTAVEYDGFGRQVRDYLPLPQSSTTNGNLYSSPSSSIGVTLYKDNLLYSEKQLEDSPLDRVLQQASPGTPWSLVSGRTVKFGYEANAVVDNVKKYVTATTWSNAATTSVLKIVTAVSPATTYYAAAQLYKNKVADEDGNITYEFKNGHGQTLLVRRMNGAVPVDTYYVYNEYDQLAFVIPPSAADATKALTSSAIIPQPTLDELCYQYRYDGKNRLVEKKLPGKGWEYMVYDKADQLILTQDANLSTLGRWLITKYDQFGRVAYTGFIGGGNRLSMQNQITSQIITENKSNTGFVKSGITVYYTNNYFTSLDTILSINYYDEYPVDAPAKPATIINTSQPTLNPVPTAYTVNGVVSSRSTRGLPTASYVKDIDDDNWTKNYTWYDTRARPVATHSYNYLGGYTKSESLLDFAGVTTMAYTYHKRTNADTQLSIADVFTYDGQNRMLTQTSQVGTRPVETLVQNSYNEIGQLITKKVGGTTAAPLQTVDYTYNVRGWMTGINSPKTLGTDLFGYIISYNILDGDFSGGNAKFNGNISQTIWKTDYTGSDAVLRNYFYTYDGLNRLLDASYSAKSQTEGDFNFYDENLTYDINGNIKTLQRFTKPPAGSTALEIDNLVYNYENGDLSNKLSKITLPVGKLNNSSGYDALQNIIGYDSNGNMTSMLDKKISIIEYNYLNLPIKITGTDGKSTTNVYRTDGVKLKKTYSLSPTSNKTTDYLDGFQYEDGVMQFVPTSEGYFDFVKNAYIYNYTDHLGNVRVSYYKNSAGVLTVLEESNYYPFGLKHEGYNQINLTTPTYNYKYNGKELQETGMYDYGARMYMPDIGRWGVVDPLAEKMTRHSVYNYAFDNPIHFIDPDGRDPIDYVNENGNKIGTDGTKDEGILMITNKRDQAAIKTAEKNGKNIALNQLNEFNGNMVVPSDSALKESLNVMNRGDANGGFREESSSLAGDVVSRGTTGSLPTITVGAGGKETATATSSLHIMSNTDTTIHLHPAGLFVSASGTPFPFDALTPTPGVDNLTFSGVGTNIIVGRLEKGSLTNITKNTDGTFTDSRPIGAAIYRGSDISKPYMTLTKKVITNIINRNGK